MTFAHRTLIAAMTTVASVVLAMAPLPADAQSRHGGGGGRSGYGHGAGGHGGYAHGGYHGHGGYGYWGPGLFWGTVGLGVGLGLSDYYYYGPPYPGYVVAAPPPVVYEPQPQPREPAAKPAPDPVIYPRNGQSPAQLEADRQDCNRWATTQQAAMADASVFYRATAACMDARGYTLR